MDNIKDLVGCESGVLAREAVKILIERKGIDVKLFDVREKSSVTDYYVNVTGRSSTNVAALADEVDAKLHDIMKDIYDSSVAAAKQYGCEGDLVAGANIAGFIKIADAMLAQGVAY